ncbi:MAG: hypothetical protein K0S97_2477 [Chloroflexota bacterium]|jgi:quinol monooxygenase YgiN|nr:hypothetical protein [Chloroflexota bacterium]
MVIVAGHITVEPEQRASYLAGCVSIVEQARRAAGCLDTAISADLIDPGRVNIFERCESQAALEAFRRSGPCSGKAQHEPANLDRPRPMRSVRPHPTEPRPNQREGNRDYEADDHDASHRRWSDAGKWPRDG